MKKSLIALFLLLCLLLSACANNNEPDSDNNTNNSSDNGVSDSNDSSDTPSTNDQTPTVSVPSSHNEQFSTDKEGIYNYCPSVMQMSDGTRYIYYCTNQESYNITDYIGCRKGTPNADGSYTWSDESIVLSPSENGWDSRHACDPSVIAGSFSYQGESYGYLMAYLGCTSNDSQDNKIGLAVAKTPEGPFIRVGSNPLVNFYMDSTFTGFQWGVGQPSLVSLDKAGSVLLFYTRGDKYGTRLMVDKWNLSNLDFPINNGTEKIGTSGLLDLNGNADIMNNADLVYDVKTDSFYAVSDCHPNPADEPNYISSHFRVTKLMKGEDFKSSSWSEIKTFSPTETNAARNHNAAILRDEYGHLVEDRFLTVYYTVSITGNTSLWSYRIYDAYIELK